MAILEELKRLSKTSIELVTGISRLAKLELQLAEKSLPTLGVLAFLFIVLITSIWLCVIALLILYLTSFGVHVWVSLLGAITVHVLLAVIVGLFLMKHARHLSFSATRKHFKSPLNS